MTQLESIEHLFFEARRSVFMVSIICFIGTGISLTALTTLDPALGMVIPALVVVVLSLFTLFFLLLAFRLFQPINEIVKMVNTLYDGIVRDVLEEEPIKALTKTEKQQFKELTKQVKDLTKKVADFENGKAEQTASEQDVFWRNFIIKCGLVGGFISVVVYLLPDPIDLFSAVIGAIVITAAVTLLYVHSKGRYDCWRLKGDET